MLNQLSKQRGSTMPFVLFVDEIHRLNKGQQDFFLPLVETETITLIGATTENPGFEINPALLSRCKVLVFKVLSEDDLVTIQKRALEKDEYLKSLGVEVEEELIRRIAQMSGGDARFALTTLEMVMEFASAEGKNRATIELLSTLLESGRQLTSRKKSDEHYDLISAFIKSLRGSDPDAALYYLVRMIDAGEDPRFIARRMIILASEDVGMADPMALLIAVAAAQAVEHVGLPECVLNLAQAAVYLSVTPKSNAVYLGVSKAKEAVKEHPEAQVPFKLRNPVTRMMKEWGYGKDYHYPHDYGGFVKENYLPEELKGRVFYHPSDSGKEKQVAEQLRRMWSGFKEYKKDK
ncbi:MAG: putative ATPase [Thermotogota bacterium]|nr:putative ATPase [Thermotogota bacterium]MDK2864711.1 putative ATPase [Thermotogota bacterium]